MTTAACWQLSSELNEIVDADPDMLTELIAMFVSDSVVRLDRLSAACTAGDFRIIRAQAHSVKGSALQMGAPGLASFCAALELAESPQPDVRVRMLSAIQDEFILVQRAMEGHLVNIS